MRRSSLIALLAAVVSALVALSSCSTPSGGPALPDGGEGGTTRKPDVVAPPDGGPTGVVEPTRSTVTGLHGVGARIAQQDVTTSTAGGWRTRSAGGGAAAGAAADGGMRSAGVGAGRGGMMPAVEPAAPPPMPTAAPMARRSMDDDGAVASARAFKDNPAANIAQRGPLKAGAIDDNANFDAFLSFVHDKTGNGVPGNARAIDVRDRHFIRVVDDAGHPVPMVTITLRDGRSEKIVGTLSTYGDGRAPFYPHVARPDGAFTNGLLVEVARDGKSASTTWKGDADLSVTLAAPASSHGAVPLDVVFLIDTTGSMGDEIAQVKSTLLGVTDKVKGLGTNVDLQYGAVLYRDVGDDYLTSTHALTKDIAAFNGALQGVDANGGGDGPESVNQGLAEAISGIRWRPQAAKLVFLIADAEPHMDYDDDIAYPLSLQDAVSLGVKVHAVAASGLDEYAAGSLVFRQIAQYTRGKFIYIEYGGDVVASGAAHGVSGGPTKSNNLDDIFLAEIKSEVEGFAR